MSTYGSQFLAFGVQNIYDYRRERSENIVAYVARLSDSELFDSDENELIIQLKGKFQIRPPVIDFDKKTHELIPGQSVTYTIPVQGDATLLRIQPSNCQMYSYNRSFNIAAIRNGTDDAVEFVIKDSGETDEVLQTVNRILDNLRINSQQLCTELGSVSASVEGDVKRAVASEKARREQQRKRNDDLRNRLP